jgi:hypothetical protein
MSKLQQDFVSLESWIRSASFFADSDFDREIQRKSLGRSLWMALSVVSASVIGIAHIAAAAVTEQVDVKQVKAL